MSLSIFCRPLNCRYSKQGTYCVHPEGENLLLNSMYALPCLRWSVTGFSRQKSGFDPWPFSVVFVVEEIALVQVFLRVTRSFCDSIIPSVLHAHLHLQVTLTKRIHGRSLRPFQRSVLLKQSGSIRFSVLHNSTRFLSALDTPGEEDSNSPQN